MNMTTPSICQALQQGTARRKFLQQGLGLAAGAFGLQLHTMAAAAASSDYRALVCVFLYGGNDNANTLIPYGTAEYAQYSAARQGATRARSELLPISTPSVRDGRSFALPLQMGALRDLYAQGKAALVANVGTLSAPITRAQYEAGSVEVPPQLFSHSDQANFWQIGVPSYATASGWGGRMTDLIAAANAGGKVSASITVAGSNLWQVGNTVVQYPLSPGDGAVGINGLNSGVYGKALKAMLATPRSHLLEQEITRIYGRSTSSAEAVGAALNAADVVAIDAGFPRSAPSTGPLAVPGPMRWAQHELMSKLSMVARMIAASGALGLKRQTFFVGLGGFDMHNSLADHKYLLQAVSDGLAAFYNATVSLGVANKVTTFTASDFGRPWLASGGGSDHGWGGHHVVVGGAVRGGNLYGRFPVIDRNGPDSLGGQGHMIPTLSVEQYAAPMARWMGVADSDLRLVLPNAGRFDVNALPFV
jgi:uncharacterized protein (DUF1501 family)